MVDRKAMEKVDRSQTKVEAQVVLAKMNAMLRKMPITEAVKDSRFDELGDRLNALGWLGLCENALAAQENGHWTQLRLVDPNSDEARGIP